VTRQDGEEVVVIEVTVEGRVLPHTERVEIPASELEGKTQSEREKIFDEYAETAALNVVNWGWGEVGE
jgi:hypothetical protein